MSDESFDQEYAASYDTLYEDKDYAAECDLMEAAVRRYRGAKPAQVLDLGCGTGSHASEWVRRGVRVHGIDRSEGMLRAASEKQLTDSALAALATFALGNVRQIRIGRSFDVVTMMFAVLGYQTTNADLTATLATVRSHLDPGGLFLCDFWYGPAVLSERPGDRIRVIEKQGAQVIRWATTALDTRAQTANVTFRLWVREGSTVKSETCETHVMRYFFAQEIDFHLSIAGMELVSLTTFPTLDVPVSDHAWNAFLVARAV